MLSFVFATKREAAPFLNKLNVCAELIKNTGQYQKYSVQGQDFIVSICGIGKVSTEKSMNHLLSNNKVTKVINSGICGSLNEGVPVFSIRSVSETILWPSIKRKTSCSTSNFKLPVVRNVKLITSEKPVFDSDLKKNMGIHADIVDMEGAIIAEKCKNHNIECCLLKGVSDMASEGDRDILFQNIDKLCNKMSDILITSFFEKEN